MKTRMGFVSNSSSSSFCIIGVKNHYRGERLADQLAEKEGMDWGDWDKLDEKCIDHGQFQGDVLVYIGGQECYCAGLYAEELLETMTIPQAKAYLRGLILEKLEIDIPLSQIEFICEEISTG